MGNLQSFQDIEKRYGQKGTDYVAAKYHERRIYERINDQIVRLNEQANLQQQQDVQFLSQQKRRFQKAFNDAKAEAETKKQGSLKEAEARHKLKAEDFSGYNEKRVGLENLEKQIKNKYATERVRMQEKVRQEVRKYQSGGSSLNKIPEYDSHPDNYRRSIENECIKKYPAKAKQVDATELERKLTWENYKQNFVSILSREQVRKQVDSACENMRGNLIPGGAPVCC